MISDSDGEAWKCQSNILYILYAFVVGLSFGMICDYLVTVFTYIAMIKHRSIKHYGYFCLDYIQWSDRNGDDDSVQHFASFS